MDIAIEDLDGGVKHVKLNGAIDIEGANTLTVPLAALAGKHDRIIVDMSGVDYIASVGIGILISNAQAVERRKGHFVIASPGGLAGDVLRTMKLDMVIPIHETLDDAIKAVSP